MALEITNAGLIDSLTQLGHIRVAKRFSRKNNIVGRIWSQLTPILRGNSNAPSSSLVKWKYKALLGILRKSRIGAEDFIF